MVLTAGYGPPMRIVSLLPSATEIACALGLRESLVGVSHECDFPRGVDALPQLTSSFLEEGLSPADIDAAVSRASLERRPVYAVAGELLCSLKPDLIITQGVCAVCAVTPETVQAGLELVRLEQVSSAPVLSLGATCYEGIKRDVRQLAEAAGRNEAAAALIEEMDRRWESLEPGPTRPRVMMLEWPDPPWTGGHWVPEQVEAAGGECLFGGPGENSQRVSWAAIAEADPDLMVAMACGFDLSTNLGHARALLDRPEIARLRAVTEGRFWAVDSNSYFSRPAPRVVEGAELLHAIFHGGPVDSAQALRVAPGAGTR